MKFPNLKITKPVLFASALGVISLSFILIDAKSSLAGSYSYQSTRCHKSASVPEPYPFVSILAFGILSGGYLLKQRLRKKGERLNDNLLPINDFSISNNQQLRQI